jgi:hypothetical protein
LLHGAGDLLKRRTANERDHPWALGCLPLRKIKTRAVSPGFSALRTSFFFPEPIVISGSRHHRVVVPTFDTASSNVETLRFIQCYAEHMFNGKLLNFSIDLSPNLRVRFYGSLLDQLIATLATQFRCGCGEELFEVFTLGKAIGTSGVVVSLDNPRANL